MIKDTLKNAIRSLSNKHGIKEKELRIKISKPKGSLRYEIMKNSEVLEETNVATALNLNTVVAFMVGNRLNAIVDSIAKGGGEINPYLFSIDPRCNSETLIYLHDSAFLKSSIDSVIASSESSFLPIWYSKKFIWDDVFDPINQSIRISMLFYSDDLSTSITLNELLLYFKKNPKLQFVVTFSGMSIFHHSFVQFIKKYTNFFLITHLFTCRKNRCLFERILSCIYFWIYRNSYPSSVCGDINEHPLCFRNTNIYINNYHNAFIKVWQGR